MCGAFSFHTRSQALQDLYPWLELDERLPESYNIRPKQPAIVVPNWPTKDKRTAKRFQFGFEAPWNPKLLLFNTRDDKFLSGKGYWKAFVNNRCIALADGFFEWKGPKGAKQPYYIQVGNGKAFAFAGIFKEADGQGSFSIITTTPNNVVGELHDRMPVILPNDSVEDWLSPDPMSLEEIAPYLKSYPDEEMQKHKVSTAVNNWRNNSAELLNAITD
jgi:putative SOS response-associated peptidase YedK